MIRARAFFLFAGLAVALAGCVTTGGTGNFLSYSPPVARAGAGTFTLGPTENAQTIAADLSALGLSVTRSSRGEVDASGRGPGLVDCGVFTQTVLGNTARFAGAAPESVVFTDPVTLDLYVRRVSVRSEVWVNIAGGTATVNERHRVDFQLRDGNGRVLSSQSQTLEPGTIVRFADGTRCAINGRVAAALR
ncbi:MAG: hypothetical protein AAF914_13745 [Pseudomonadota bacterium]